METKASAKFVRISPRKVRLVADVIRGLDVDQALVQLQFITKGATGPLRKLLKSAISNAIENHQLESDNLLIKEIRVDSAQTLHRWTPRAFGRATPIRKRSSKITLVLAEKVPTTSQPKTKKAVTGDLITVGSVDELKALEKTTTTDDKVESTTDQSGSIKGKGHQKGFVNKVFNRKSG